MLRLSEKTITYNFQSGRLDRENKAILFFSIYEKKALILRDWCSDQLSFLIKKKKGFPREKYNCNESC